MYLFNKMRIDLGLLIRSHAFVLALFSLAMNLSCENAERDAYQTKTNSPPVITSAKILPERPTIGRELNVIVQSQDPDHDPVTNQYQWTRNGEEIAGENTYVLRNGKFRKGDLIRVKVTPSDGKVSGPPFLSDPVEIINSTPVLQVVWIEPKVAHLTDRLKANVKSSDPDGDDVYYTYRWKRNGEVWNEESNDFLEGGRFKKGNSITVTVTPDDRENSGKPATSAPVIVLNSPPRILSSPPTSVEGTKHVYQVRADDLDNDPLTFTLKSGPKGMEIDKETGLIQWRIQREDKGKHIIEIEVSDDAGAKSTQRYTLAVDFR